MSKKPTIATTQSLNDDPDFPSQRILVGWLCLVAAPEILIDLANGNLDTAKAQIGSISGMSAGKVDEIVALYTNGLVGAGGYVKGSAGELSKAIELCAGAFAKAKACPYLQGHCPEALGQLGESITVAEKAAPPTPSAK